MAVSRPLATVVGLANSTHPADWTTYSGSPLVIYPSRSGTLEVTASVPTAGRGLWLAGSFRRQLDVLVDGRPLATARDRLTHPGVVTPFGQLDLTAGRHLVKLRYSSVNLRPGSGGDPFAIGPLLLSRPTPGTAMVTLAPRNARSLCGRSLDWIEAVAA